MKRPLMLTCLAASALSLSACYDDGYDGGVSVGWSSYPYYGWYDGYYGSIYDGYWGPGDVFYYRLSPQDRSFRRGDARHFRRGDTRPSDTHFRRFDGNLRPPPRGTTMPRFQAPQNHQRDRNQREYPGQYRSQDRSQDHSGDQYRGRDQSGDHERHDRRDRR